MSFSDADVREDARSTFARLENCATIQRLLLHEAFTVWDPEAKVIAAREYRRDPLFALRRAGKRQGEYAANEARRKKKRAEAKRLRERST